MYTIIKDNEWVNAKGVATPNPYWEKIALLLKHFHEYDYLVWIDGDAFVPLDSPRLENILDKHPDKHLLVSRDIDSEQDFVVNAGFYIVKCSLIGETLLSKWLYDDSLTMNGVLNDQGVVQRMLYQNTMNICNYTQIFPFGLLQNFGDFSNKSDSGCYKCRAEYSKYGLNHGYVLHFPGEYRWMQRECEYERIRGCCDTLVCCCE